MGQLIWKNRYQLIICKIQTCEGIPQKNLYDVDVTKDMFTSLIEGDLVAVATRQNDNMCEVLYHYNLQALLITSFRLSL